MENTEEKRILEKRVGKQYEKVLAAMVSYVFDMMSSCRSTLSENKPSCNSKEFKIFSRILKGHIDENNRHMAYKLDEEHRAEVIRLKNELSERIAYSMQMMYFSVRNEVINTEMPADTIEPVVSIRMLDIFIDSLGNVAEDLGFSLRRSFAEITDILKAFCSDWEDKGGHQKLCEQIIIKEVNQMFLCA